MLGSKLDILKTEWLDVVFTDRNKTYGAYQLRKNNGRNTMIALLITGTLFVFAVSLPTIINKIKGLIPPPKEEVKIQEVVLIPPPPINEKTPPPPPPPSAEPQKPKVDQVKFPPPIVKPDEQVREKDPPTQEDLKTADPGQKDIKGDPTQTVRIDEPVGNAPVSAAVVESNPNEIFTSVEQLPEFPGGIDKFYKYLNKVLRYPAVAQENGVQGRVNVTFVVERDGSLTDVKAAGRTLGSGLEEEAIRVLKSSPKWNPGKQNGRAVRVQYTVPVVFTLADQ
ncbi:TonB family protein [Mucilaginibacter daejeonensis]|uniref:energy transducer TonB n=1 Tax=Mucilaginibacter daejeonensis TaxID=398049 RepID=UPI001D1774AB|nr:energy transducer TonB [Mucilaginibacter daejeonensis]UEG52917.1 TonB family protein [Mucilaginibacter daejeonensis]